MSLFQKGTFKLHSGEISDFKIEADDLTYADVETLAYLISKKYTFSKVFGVPRGGLKLEQALTQYCSDNPNDITLVVDDVCTTGNSISTFIKENNIKNSQAVVIFTRNEHPSWIDPIFQMW